MADLILICFLALYAYIGFKNGFIKSVINFASTLISLLLTSFIYPPISEVLYKIGIGDMAKGIALNFLEGKAGAEMDPDLLHKAAEAASIIIVNVISFIAVIIIIKAVLVVLVKSLNLVAKLPLIKQANSLLGLIAGLVSGILISYIIIGVIAALGENDTISVIHNYIENSSFAISMYKDNIVTNLLTEMFSQ